MSEADVGSEAIDNDLWEQVADRAEELLDSDKSGSSIRTFPDKAVLAEKVLAATGVIDQKDLPHQHQDTTRAYELPVGGGGYAGIRLQEYTVYGPDQPEVASKLVLRGWKTVEGLSATDQSSSRDETVWEYTLSPELDTESLQKAHRILSGEVQTWDEARDLVLGDERNHAQ